MKPLFVVMILFGYWYDHDLYK